MDQLKKDRSIVRRPTLDEWFLIHQLKKIKNQLHLPLYIDLEITKLSKHFTSRNEKVPYTALLIKASSILLNECPYINKAVFHTFYGPRFVDIKYNSVNLPLFINKDGKRMLTGMTIENAYLKSLIEIQKEIKKAANKPISELPINKILHYGKNNFINRAKLRILYFLLYHFPKNYIKHKVGGISVSSIMNKSNPEVPLSMMAYSNTGLTISSCSEYKRNDKTFIKLGIAWDHMTCHGERGHESVSTFCQILKTINDEHFEILTN